MAQLRMLSISYTIKALTRSTPEQSIKLMIKIEPAHSERNIM
jgi:hypothetical protein